MTIKQRIIFNGKFLSADATGVHRVAEELYVSTMALINAAPRLKAALDVELWIPRDAQAKAQLLGFDHKVIGKRTGIFWEQVELPLHAKGDITINLCNVGPVLHHNSVTMFHDAQVHISPQSYSRAFRFWYHFHQPLAGRNNRKILTVSHYSREQLARYKIAPLSKIDVVHNGVDHVLRLTPDTGIIDKAGLRGKTFVLGLSSVQQHKNIGLLLKAFADLQLRDVTLVLFGGARRGSFAAEGYHVPENVTFAGRVSDSELVALMNAAIALCFPSTTEGFGLPPLEAMALGCPAVIAPNGALPEVCGPDAIYAAADDPQAWVKAIRKLVDDPAYRKECSDKAVDWASDFTWARSAEVLMQSILRATGLPISVRRQSQKLPPAFAVHE